MLDRVVVGRGHVVGAERQRELELAALQPRQRVLGLGERQRQLDGGMALPEGRDGERHQRRAGRLEGGHAQAPAAQAGDRLELRLGLGQPAEDRLGVADQRAARVGEADAAHAALDERRPGLALERGDLLRDGGLGERQGLGGGGERAALGDLAQDPHAADVKHQRAYTQPVEASFELIRPIRHIEAHTRRRRAFQEHDHGRHRRLSPLRRHPPRDAPTAPRSPGSPALDSKPAPRGHVLLAEVEGDIPAALALDDGHRLREPVPARPPASSRCWSCTPAPSSPLAVPGGRGLASPRACARRRRRELHPPPPPPARRLRRAGRPAGVAGLDRPLDRLRGLGLDLPGDPRHGRDRPAVPQRRRALRFAGARHARVPRRAPRRRGAAPGRATRSPASRSGRC